MYLKKLIKFFFVENIYIYKKKTAYSLTIIQRQAIAIE